MWLPPWWGWQEGPWSLQHGSPGHLGYLQNSSRGKRKQAEGTGGILVRESKGWLLLEVFPRKENGEGWGGDLGRKRLSYLYSVGGHSPGVCKQVFWSRHTRVEMDGICELGQAEEWAMGTKVLSATGRGLCGASNGL